MIWEIGLVALAICVCVNIFTITKPDNGDAEPVSAFTGVIIAIFIFIGIFIGLVSYKESDLINDPQLVEMGCTALPDNYFNGLGKGVVLFMTMIVSFCLISFRTDIFYFLNKENREYHRIMRKVDRLDNAIKKSSYNTREYRDILVRTKDKLEKQAELVYINKGIQIAKELELSNPDIDIRQELDELEALQKLNEVK